MSRKTGSIPEETKRQLFDAATAEFYEYGFQKASLRSICERAGTTTGALYAYFKDKDDLFSNVISPATGYVLGLMKDHYERELDHPFVDMEDAEAEDLRATQAVLDFYYNNKMRCDILLQNQKHPAVAAFFDEIVTMMDRQTVLTFEMFRKSGRSKNDFELDPLTVHWFSHLQVDALLNIVSHVSDRELAQRRLRQMLKFLEAGIFGLFRNG